MLKDTTWRPEWGSNPRPLDPESEMLTTSTNVNHKLSKTNFFNCKLSKICKAKKKKLLFPITRPCVPKKTLLKLFFFNFTIDKIPNLPRADSDHFTSTIHACKCKNRDGNDVNRSLLLSTQFKIISERQHSYLKGSDL